MNHRRAACLAVCFSILFALESRAKEDPKKPYVGAAAPALSPEEAQKHFKVPPGFEVRLFAAEPDVINPVAMSFDEKGRLWVVEAYEYPYERWTGNGRKGRDRVICLEAPNGEERATKRTVVVEDLWLATAITFGNGGIYVGQAPDMYFYPITDTPDGPKAGERKTLLTGFGLDDKHELLNSFCWGPDGWLYMTHGVFTNSKVRHPEDKPESAITFNAGVGRYNPYTKVFEVWCDGISNQWGIDWDAAGNAFVSACVIDHIWHVIPGGVYVRQGGVPTIPYTYQLLPAINKDKHRHYMAAYAGMNIYQGNLFPEEYRGNAFMGNIHGNCLDRDQLSPDGSSFTATDVRTVKDTGEFLEANDDWFRPVSSQTGPDGAIWIMDWYDKYPCYQNSKAPDLDREKGRIWRLVYTGKEPDKTIPTHAKEMDLEKLSTRDLVAQLTHPNIWQRRAAQRVMTERAKNMKAFPTELVEMALRGMSRESRMAAIWTMGSISPAGFAYQVAKDLSADPAPAIRAWTAQFLGELASTAPAKLIDETAMPLLKTLAADKEPSVLAAVAEAARRLAAFDTRDVIVTLVRQPGADKDPHLPFLIWRATEPKVVGGKPDGRRAEGVVPPEMAAAMAAHLPRGENYYVHDSYFLVGSPAEGVSILEAMAKAPGDAPAVADLTRRIIHRLVDAGDVERLGAAVVFINGLKPEQSAIARGAVQGLLDTQQKKGAKAPEGTAGLDLAKLQASGDKALGEAAGRLAAIWGNGAAAEAGLRIIGDAAKPEEERLKAVRLARQLDSDAARKAVSALLAAGASDALKLEAIRALGEIGTDDSPAAILNSWKTFSPDTRRAAVEVLTSRLPWAKTLLKAVEAKTVAASDVSALALRTLSQQKDNEIQALVKKTIGTYRPSDADKLALIAAKKRVMLGGPVDYEAGHLLAQKTCLVCHNFYGEGMHVGPDLTGVGRSTIDALLTNVIDPNQIIGAGYENTVIETKDHRNLSGRLVENTDDHVKLLSAGDKEDVVGRADIALMRTERISVMPEGLVDQMPDADLRNLLWYIYSPVQDNKDKRVRVDLLDKRLVIKAKLPGSGEMTELLEYSIAPAKRPHAHPLKDPSGAVVLSRTPDAAGRGGVFFDLGDNDAPASVELIDVTAANDRAAWRMRVRWNAGETMPAWEEEQQFSLHALDAANRYRIDVEWVVRAKDKPLVFGENSRGLSVFLGPPGGKVKGDSVHHTTDISGSFGDRWFGVSTLRHPGNPSAPGAAWFAATEGGAMLPWADLKDAASRARTVRLDAGKEQTFHYRLVIHAGTQLLETLDAEANQFGAVTFEGDAPPKK